MINARRGFHPITTQFPPSPRVTNGDDAITGQLEPIHEPQKSCPKCERTLPVSCFGSDVSNHDGLQAYCRVCRREYRRKKYKEDPEERERVRKYNQAVRELHPEAVRERDRAWARKNPSSGAARQAVHRAIRNGTLTKPEACETCGAKTYLQGHHHKGYSRENWLNVRWLCFSCHKREDMKKYLTDEMQVQ